MKLEAVLALLHIVLMLMSLVVAYFGEGWPRLIWSMIALLNVVSATFHGHTYITYRRG